MAHTDNVVGFWDLDSDSADDSGNGNAGTDTGMSYDGTSASFSGSEYITLPDNLVTTQGTLALWFNAGTGSSYQNVASIGPSGANSQLLQIAYGEPETAVFNAYGVAFVSYSSFNQFDHFVATNDGSTMKIYYNGSIGTNGAYVSAGTYHGTIGQGVGGWSGFHGKVRCVAIYSDVKDATWAAADYNSGTPKKWADWAGGGGGGGVFNPYYYRLLAGAA